jgi:polysaccharide biosynthesis protein PslG
MLSRVALTSILLALLLLVPGCGAAAVQRQPHRGTATRPPAPTAIDLQARRQAGPCAIAARPLALVRPGAPLLIGMSANLRSQTGRSICTGATEVRLSGAAAVREDLQWARVEPRPGVFDWSYFDRVAGFTAQRGLVLLPLIDDTPAWAAAGGLAVARNPAQFASFVAAAVARYGPGGSYWRAHPALADRAPRYFELYNEPYGTPSALGGPDPAAYGRDVIAASLAGRKANPAARYLLAADLYTAGSNRAWIEDLYRTVPKLREYVAGVAVHPYTDQPVAQLSTGDGARDELRRVERIEAIMRAHGDGGVPLWLTEIGWPSCMSGSPCVGERGQAEDITALFTLARTRWRGFVHAIFYYQLHDNGPGTSHEPEEWFGLLRPDGSPKPAWAAFRAAAALDTPGTW